MRKLFLYLLCLASFPVLSQTAISKTDKPGMAFCAYGNIACAQQHSLDKDCPVMTLESLTSNGLTYSMIWFDAKGVFHRQPYGVGGVKSLTSATAEDPLRLEAEIPSGTRVILKGDAFRGNGKIYPGCNVITVLYTKNSSSPYEYKCCWNVKEGEYFEADLFGATLFVPKE